jgi:hypothetical protein
MTKFLSALIAVLSLSIPTNAVAGGIFDADAWKDPGQFLPRAVPNFNGLAPWCLGRPQAPECNNPFQPGSGPAAASPPQVRPTLKAQLR